MLHEDFEILFYWQKVDNFFVDLTGNGGILFFFFHSIRLFSSLCKYILITGRKNFVRVFFKKSSVEILILT